MNMLQFEERLVQEMSTFDSDARSKGHTMTNIGTGQCDQAECSCGWRGTVIDDDTFFIRAEWERHVEEASGDGQVVMNF